MGASLWWRGEDLENYLTMPKLEKRKDNEERGISVGGHQTGLGGMVQETNLRFIERDGGEREGLK